MNTASIVTMNHLLLIEKPSQHCTYYIKRFNINNVYHIFLGRGASSLKKLCISCLLFYEAAHLLMIDMVDDDHTSLRELGLHILLDTHTVFATLNAPCIG